MTTFDTQQKVDLADLIDGAAVVYSLPTLYRRLDEAINLADSSITDIAKIISSDAGLASHLLRLANSPMYGYHSEIDSMTRAITIIGTQQLRDLTLAISVMENFNGLPSGLINMQTFWQHSIGCGVVARVLATFCRENNVERFFVAGVLHDIGQLLLCTRVPDLVSQMLDISTDQGQPHYVVQNNTLGFDHGRVSGELLRCWHIPSNIVEPVSFHHFPDLSRQYPFETALLHVSDVISHALQVGFGGEPFVPPLDQACWNYLGLPATILPSVLKEVDNQLQETLAILDSGGQS